MVELKQKVVKHVGSKWDPWLENVEHNWDLEHLRLMELQQGEEAGMIV